MQNESVERNLRLSQTSSFTFKQTVHFKLEYVRYMRLVINVSLDYKKLN